jgi:hypothetical protein
MMRKANEWTVAGTRKLAEMKEAGVVAAEIAKNLGKTKTQVHNKWMYVKNFGLERALRRARDFYDVQRLGNPTNGAHAVTDAFRSAAEVEVDATPVFTQDQLRLAMQLVVSVGDIDRSVALLRRLSEIAV